MLNEVFSLRTGITIQKIGLGTYQLSGATCQEAVSAALKIGYRHIDTGVSYKNYSPIKAAISSYARSSLFLSSKVPPNLQGYDNAVKATLDTLSELGTDYLDLMLVHWPGATNKRPTDPEQVTLRHET